MAKTVRSGSGRRRRKASTVKSFALLYFFRLDYVSMSSFFTLTEALKPSRVSRRRGQAKSLSRPTRQTCPSFSPPATSRSLLALPKSPLRAPLPSPPRPPPPSLTDHSFSAHRRGTNVHEAAPGGPTAYSLPFSRPCCLVNLIFNRRKPGLDPSFSNLT